MYLRVIPRLLGIGLILTLAFAAAPRFRMSAAERINWTESHTQEDVLMQECGSSDITGSYTVEIAHRVVVENTGEQVADHQAVNFSGSIGNAASGKSYQYDGHFTRHTSYYQFKAFITNFELRFEVGTPGQITVAVDRLEMDLAPDPAEVVKQFVPNALQMDLCYLLGGAVAPGTGVVEPAAATIDLGSYEVVPGYHEIKPAASTVDLGGYESIPGYHEINPSISPNAENVIQTPNLDQSDWCDIAYQHGKPC